MSTFLVFGMGKKEFMIYKKKYIRVALNTCKTKNPRKKTITF
jgi:hypothetical protein